MRCGGYKENRVKGRSWAECGECGRLEGYGTKIMLNGDLCVVGY